MSDSPNMVDLDTPEGMEVARRALAARECIWHGHAWEIIETFGHGPVAIVCSRGCGEPPRNVVGQESTTERARPRDTIREGTTQVSSTERSLRRRYRAGRRITKLGEWEVWLYPYLMWPRRNHCRLHATSSLRATRWRQYLIGPFGFARNP